MNNQENNYLKMSANKRLTGILATAAIILSIPLVAMQFTNEVQWSPRDFLIMGVLLFGTGLVIELLLRKFKNTSTRIVICATVLTLLFLTWAELAVGIFGTPFAGS